MGSSQILAHFGTGLRRSADVARLRAEAERLYQQLPAEEQDPRRLSRLLHGPTLRLKADEANVAELLREVRRSFSWQNHKESREKSRFGSEF